MSRLVKVAVLLAVVAGIAAGAWVVFNNDVDWAKKAREQAARLASACKPRCTRSRLVQTDDGRWRVRLETAGGIAECFLLQPREQKEGAQKSGVSPCKKEAISGWWRDWKSVHSYRPPSEIASLASEAGMSNLGMKLFFTGHPRIVERADLPHGCSDRRSYHVLGCITPGGSIFVLRVSRKDLHGVMVNAAAHEMLHAAYARLRPGDRNSVDALLVREYNNGDREALRREAAPYSILQRANELHSRLGTEYANLSPRLETYFARYFEARGRLVRAYAEEKAVFKAPEKKAAAIFARIKQLENRRRRLDIEMGAVGAEMDARKRGGDIGGYNALVPRYNELVAAHNQLVRDLRAAVDAWKQKERELKELDRSLS